MSLSDVRAVGTDYLNEAFGWKGAQHMEQQDIQEAMRIIFDTMERALFGTDYEQAMRSLFRGKTQRYKNCLTCNKEDDHEEIFYDLQLQVKEIPSLDAALVAFATPELMDGDNRIYCEICQSKQDMLLGSRLH
jgi:ubiquitin C-terminal hydrolase